MLNLGAGSESKDRRNSWPGVLERAGEYTVLINDCMADSNGDWFVDACLGGSSVVRCPWCSRAIDLEVRPKQRFRVCCLLVEFCRVGGGAVSEAGVETRHVDTFLLYIQYCYECIFYVLTFLLFAPETLLAYCDVMACSFWEKVASDEVYMWGLSGRSTRVLQD